MSCGSDTMEKGGVEGMNVCALCNKMIVIDKYFSRSATCPSCSGDLHICFNCTFYSESSHNKCVEPKAEFQRTRDKANFCDYFIFMDSDQATSKTDKNDVKKKFDDLFRQ
ncbi:MAG: hypothetical protein JSV13_09410 [Nitrospiraceae bacterium]|nr:MAG: hypothetical protein JSV13_09410 [Nitrospiraceae bacterium]